MPTLNVADLIEPPVLATRRPTPFVSWMRCAWLIAAVTAVGACSTGSAAAFVIAAVGALAAMILWSGLMAVNVRRARPRTVYSAPPSAVAAMAAWLVPGACLVVALVAISEQDAVVPWWGWLSVLPAAVIIGSLAPVAALARLARWAGDRSDRWWQWLWAPLLVAVLSLLVMMALNMSTAQSLGEGRVVFPDEALDIVIAVVAVMPMVIHFVLGWQAMRHLEAAARMSWERRAYPDETLDLTSVMAQRVAAAKYLETHPRG